MEIIKKTTSFKAILSIFFLMGILLIPSVLASPLDFLNSKKTISFDEQIQIGNKIIDKLNIVEEYPAIQINSWLGLGGSKLSGVITEHTNSCGNNCYSILEIYQNQESPLIQEIRFVGDQPKSYKIFIQDGKENLLIDDFQEVCLEYEVKEEIDLNKTIERETLEIKEIETYQLCSMERVGQKIEEVPIWKEYKINSNLPKGNYVVRIEGVKDIFAKTDWQIKTQGKWLNEWAEWDKDLVAYYSADEDGSFPDATDNGHDGTINGATYTDNGKINGAYEFNGTTSIFIGSLAYVSKSYWAYNGTEWKNIVVTGNGTYVNGEFACPSDMAYIDKMGGYCIDKYEASMPSATSSVMGSGGDIANRNNPGLMPAMSKPNVIPWVEISQINSRTACSNAGKHLCTDEEWLGAANLHGQHYFLPTNLNVAPYYCITDSATYCSGASYNSGSACPTGKYKSGDNQCNSAEGVFDMVGNVWEWTNATVDTTNPVGSSGWKYLNANTMSFQTSTDANTKKYGDDGVYFASSTQSNRAVQRGGYWGAGAIDGLFCAYLDVAPDYTHYPVGFRCCSAPN